MIQFLSIQLGDDVLGYSTSDNCSYISSLANYTVIPRFGLLFWSTCFGEVALQCSLIEPIVADSGTSDRPPGLESPEFYSSEFILAIVIVIPNFPLLLDGMVFLRLYGDLDGPESASSPCAQAFPGSFGMTYVCCLYILSYLRLDDF